MTYRTYLALGLLTLASSSLSAAVIVHEGFAYSPAGTPLETLNGGTDSFNGAWTDNGNIPSTITNGSLSYDGVETSGGAVLVNGSLDRRLIDVITPTNGSTTWVSYLFRTSDSSLDGNEIASFSVAPNSPGQRPEFGIFNSGGTFYFGIRAPGLASEVIISPTAVFEVQTTYFVLASILWDTDGTDKEVINLYINPTIGQPLGTPALTRSDINIETAQTSGGISRLDRLFIEAGGAAWTFDELRISNDMGGAIPEPSTAALAIAALGGLGLSRVRKR